MSSQTIHSIQTLLRPGSLAQSITWRLERKAALGMLLVLITFSLIGWLYLTQASSLTTTSFQIEQTIMPMKEDKTLMEEGIKKLGDLFRSDDQDAVTSIYKRTGTSIHDVEYIVLDVSKVSDGKKTLAIRVTDLIAGTSAIVTKDFIVR